MIRDFQRLVAAYRAPVVSSLERSTDPAGAGSAEARQVGALQVKLGHYLQETALGERPLWCYDEGTQLAASSSWTDCHCQEGGSERNENLLANGERPSRIAVV
jgi:hypothetical protein